MVQQCLIEILQQHVVILTATAQCIERDVEQVTKTGGELTHAMQCSGRLLDVLFFFRSVAKDWVDVAPGINGLDGEDVIVHGLEKERGEQGGLHFKVLIDGLALVVRKVRFVAAVMGLFQVGEVGRDDQDRLVHGGGDLA